MPSKDKTIEKLEASNQNLDDYLLEIGKWDFVRPENGWDIKQVLFHLFTVENLSYKYLKYKLANDSNFENSKVWKSVMFHLYKLKAQMTEKMVAPESVTADNITITQNVNEIIEDWINTRKAMTAMILSLDEDFFNKAMYKHPIGRLTLYQMLDFFDFHIERHKKQINRLRLS